MRWQRILRPALGLFALAFAIWVYVSIRERKPVPASAGALRTDKDAVVESTTGQSFRQKGAEWHEIVARATEIASGAPVVVTQTIRFAPAGYVRMLGVVKADAREAVLPRFRTLFDGVEVE